VHHAPRPTRQLQVVGDDDERRARLAVECQQQVRDRPPGLAVEVAGGLVGEQQARAGGEGPSNADALLFAPGELRRIVVESRAEPYALEQVASAVLRCRRSQGPLGRQQLERHQHVLESGEGGQELKALEDEADALGAQGGAAILVERIQRHTVEAHAAFAGSVEAGEQAQQRRLAAARGAEHRHDLSGGHVEVHAFQHRQGRTPSRSAIALGEISGDDHRMRARVEVQQYRLSGRGAAACRASRLTLAALAVLAACGAPDDRAPPASGPAGGIPAAAAEPAIEQPVVLFLGDSLTAGFGVGAEEAYPARIQQRIDAARLDYRVVNAGVSGDTSAGGRRRIAWLLRQPVAVLVLALGANDMLRGQSLDALRDNLRAIIAETRAAYPAARTVIAGMRAPSNLGRRYVEGFDAIFPALASETHSALVPFLLEGVAGDARLNQSDGVHPNAAGHRVIAETVWKVLEPLLQAQPATSG